MSLKTPGSESLRVHEPRTPGIGQAQSGRQAHASIKTNSNPSGFERRLAAVVFADVAGFSRLIGNDDVGTLESWSKMRHNLLFPFMERYDGRLAALPGDALLIEFPSAVSAVSFAVDVQRALAGQPAEGEVRLELRMGINVDDIIDDEGTLQSDGVNIAARIQQDAQPGEIVVTSAVRALVERRLPLSFRDLGTPEMKNIVHPVHIYAIDLESKPSSSPAPTVQPFLDWGSRPTLAVLPFRNLNNAIEDRYFGEGITDDIITGLSRSRTLFVIARTSTIQFRDSEDDVRTIGKALGVKYLLTGTVRRHANRLRINAELNDVDGAYLMWAERYDGSAEELFEFQDGIVSSIVASLEPKVRRAETERIRNRPTESLDAYDCVLKAIASLYEFTADSYIETEYLLKRAVEVDPDYAQAYAYIAWRMNFWIGEGHSTDLRGDRERALDASRRAVLLDPDDAFALAVRGHLVSFIERRPTDAVELLEQAILSDENSPLAWALASVTHAYLGNGDAARERLRNVWQLTPFDPLNFFFWIIAGIGEFVADRLDEAVVWMRKSNRANPNFVATLRMLAATQALLGDEAEARVTGSRLLEVEPGFSVSKLMAGYPLIRAEDREKLARGLRLAGLPE